MWVLSAAGLPRDSADAGPEGDGVCLPGSSLLMNCCSGVTPVICKLRDSLLESVLGALWDEVPDPTSLTTSDTNE